MDFIDYPNIFAEFAIGLFFAILYLKTGLDKVFSFSSEFAKFQAHTSTSRIVFILVLILEILAGMFSGAGLINLLVSDDTNILINALYLSIATILVHFLLATIRSNKEIQMAQAIYFLIALVGLHFLML